MNQSPELVITGYTNIDENIVPNHEPIVLPGGAGYFVSVAASRIVKNVGLVTRIGRDFDSTFLKTRVSPVGIHQIPDKDSSRSIQTYHSETDMSKRDIQLLDGVSSDLNPQDIPKKWISTMKHVHVATMPPKQQKLFITFLKTNAPQAIISIDTDQFLLKNKKNVALIEKLCPLVDMVFVNRLEYPILQSVLNKHPFVIYKTDKAGAEYISHGEILAHANAPVVSAVDTTGAGDIFAGTYLASFLSGKSIIESLQEATNVASASITKQGISHLF